MRERKIRRRLPCDLYQLGILGHWLDEQSAHGLHLERLNNLWAVFRKDKPQPCRYRFYPCSGRAESPGTGQNDLFRELGWEYVTTLQSDFAVFRCTDPSAPELCTDPVVEAETFRRCDKKFLQSLVWMIAEPFFSVLIYFGMNWMMYGGMMNDTLWRSSLSVVHLYAGGFEILAALLLFLGTLWVGAVRRFRSIHALRRGLLRGEPIDYTAPIAQRRGLSLREWKGIATAALFLSLIWLNCVDKQFFPNVTEPVPAPLLSNLEGEGFQYGNRASMESYTERKTTILADLFCETRQSSTEQLLWLDSTYIRVRFPQLAEPVFHSLTESSYYDKTNAMIFGEAIRQDVPAMDTRFDALDCFERQRIFPDGTKGSRSWTVTAWRGCQVISAHYTGEQPLSRLLEELDNTMKRFEEEGI